MAESVEAEQEWNDWALETAEDTVMAMETLVATLRAFEDVLRQQEISVASSTEYCDNFCQALMHYAGSRNSMEHGLPLLEVYCLSINCFAAARSHLTAESDRVALVLKRLALSCFELLLSVPENEIPLEAWIQFHHSVQIAHDMLLQYGSTDLQALLQITGEGGAWSNPVLTALLTGQPTNLEEVNAYINLEGEGFMEMRVKHLEKMGEVAKAVVLAKSCTECNFFPNQATFRQTYVSLLCQLLPNEEAIMEISRLDCKDVLEITSTLETEGEENTAFILCTTYLTQQLQQQNLYCSWELILLWSKLQRKLDPSLVSLLDRCLQLGAIAKTVQHLLYLVRVIQTEADNLWVPVSVELCVKALQLPKQDDLETRTSICKTVSCLLPNDLEVLRTCQLTEFLLGPSQEAFTCLEELYLRPDQKYDHESAIIPNSLRCELLLALKAYWPFDPEFWDWKTLKYHCISLLGLRPESEEEDEDEMKQHDLQGVTVKVEAEQQNWINGGLDSNNHQDTKPLTNCTELKEEYGLKRPKFCCQICQRYITDIQIIHHSKRHIEENNHPCPVCLEKYETRKDLIPHMRKHFQNEMLFSQKVINNKEVLKLPDEDDDIEPGEIPIDPSLMLYYKSTHDPELLNHIVQQAKTVKEKHADDDEHVTFDYIDNHFKLQNREEYPCPGTNCTRVFKHSKYLYVHLKSEHIGDENVKYFHQMRDKREKCVFCRRHFVSAYHHRKHRKVHYGDQPYMCVVIGCGARFGTSNELVTHKQTHGYQLNYQCELKGCYVTYSDLGQIYHHEAQHFRDAAFTCCSGECKKFYLSKKEFIKHLSTHNITFTEGEFEAQRKAKRKLFKTVREVAVRPSKSVDSAETVNGDVLNSQSMSGASSSQESDVKEPKATITLVAMCFDGSKFTCGFEKCGMTFSRARDVQRHLKCAHPEHLKLENKDNKDDKEQDSVLKGIKTETHPDDEDSGKQERSTPFLHVESGKNKKVFAHSKGKETSSSGLNAKGDALKEIVIGLSKLSLNASSSHSLPAEPSQSSPDSSTSQMSLHQAIISKPPVVLLKKRPHLSEEKVNVQTEQTLVTSEEECLESLAAAKPYICEIKGCGFRTAQSYSLLRHYNNLHGHSIEEAKRLTSLKTTSFKPYICHLCSKSHREKHVLRAHYINTHKMSKNFVDQISWGSFRLEETKAPTSPTGQTSQSFTNHSPKVKKNESPKQENSHESKNSTTIGENGQNIDNHSPSDEEGEDEAESREEGNEQQGQSEDKTTHKLRTRRLVAKNNLCYILDKFSKPFHCVAKNCDAAFSTQGGLVRHLQLVHHYNRSQLLWEKDCDVHHTSDVRKDPAKKRPQSNSDEPQRQFKCHFANCTASYHLKSSLVRHTRDYHSQPPGLIRCKFEGCSRVFSHNDALKKHTLYSHCEYYDSLVVRLQSTHKKSISGCQKKLIVAPHSPQKEESSPLTAQKSDVKANSERNDQDLKEKKSSDRSKSRRNFSRFVFRSHEEALQMCQDRCLRVTYPCMVQDCDSVVTYLNSLNRHYLRVHHMTREQIVKNVDKLIFTAEKLEELIQKKSARNTVTEETECQAETESTSLPSPTFHNSKTETQNEGHDTQEATEKKEDSHSPKKVSEEESLDPQKLSEKKDDSPDLQQVSEKEDGGPDLQQVSEKKDGGLDPQKVSEKKDGGLDPQQVSEKMDGGLDPQQVSEKMDGGPDPQQVAQKKKDGGLDPQQVSEKKDGGPNPQQVSEKDDGGLDPQQVSEKKDGGPDPQQVSEKNDGGPDPQQVSEKDGGPDHQQVSEKDDGGPDLQQVSEMKEESCDLQRDPEKEEQEEELTPTDRNGVLVVDKAHHGESNSDGPSEDSPAPHNTPKQEKSNIDKYKPFLRPVTVDLSPPYSLRFSSEEKKGTDASSKDDSKTSVKSASLPSAPVRQPLKRKNELSEQPLNLKETQPKSPSPCPFDIAAYKPMGFESSFLKFIQETAPKENDTPVKQRETFRRSCSVKENNQLGISHTRSRRSHSSQTKSHTLTGDFTSVQNLKSILDKALAGCGDLAIKQLQYLRPVVVLGRPVSNTTLANLFPSETNNSKLLLGS